MLEQVRAVQVQCREHRAKCDKHDTFFDRLVVVERELNKGAVELERLIRELNPDENPHGGR
jgi:hypothetical protein